MSEYETVEYYHYCPEGVQRVLASGASSFVGEIDDSTILKYPLEPGGDMSRLAHEYRILSLIGQHPRIIALKGFTDAGLYLERAVNETIYKYLVKSIHNPPTLQQRVAWCREVTEAVDYIHSKGVIHCDIQPTNILIDGELHAKLADFQGNYVLDTGEFMAGWSGEPCRYFCPREDEFEANIKTDLFALGSTIHFIMTNQEVFPDIVGGEDGWQETIKFRFASGIFPHDSHACDNITRKCWTLKYNSATEVFDDIRAIEKHLMHGQHLCISNTDIVSRSLRR
jgi:serine/threonine protein kinase